jgi:hypothetical protein
MVVTALMPFSSRFPGDCREASSRRVRRLAVRMSNLEASHQPQSQRPRASHRPRSQSNVYSACPRRARMPDPTGEPTWAAAGGLPARSSFPGLGAGLEPSSPPFAPL